MNPGLCTVIPEIESLSPEIEHFSAGIEWSNPNPRKGILVFLMTGAGIRCGIPEFCARNPEIACDMIGFWTFDVVMLLTRWRNHSRYRTEADPPVVPILS